MWKREEGISLIELMATIAFIGIIVITSTLVFTNSIHVGKMSDHRNQALNLAEMVIEELQTYEYTSSELAAGSHNYMVSGFSNAFTVTYTVINPEPADLTKWDDAGQPLLKELAVVVHWRDGDKARQLQLTTYRAKQTL